MMKTVSKKSLLFLLFAFCYYNAVGGIDNDTSSIKTLLKQATEHSINADSGLKHINKALAIAKYINEDKWIFEATLAKSKWYTDVALDYDSALLIVRELLARNTNPKNIRETALAYRVTGAIFQHKQVDSAMYYILKSLELFASLKDSAEYNITKGYYAKALFQSGRHSEAIKIYYELISYYNRTKNLDQEAANHMGCGMAYTDIQDYEKGEYHYKRSVALRKILKNEYNLAIAVFNMADVFNKTNRNAEAKNAYLFTKNTGEKLNNRLLRFLGYAGLATFASNEKQWDDVIVYANKVLVFGPKIKTNESGANNLLYQAYENKKDYKNALEYYKVHVAANNSLHSAERLKKADELEAQYQNKEKQSQIELLNKEKNIQQNIAEKQMLIRNAVIFFSLTIILFGVLLLSRIRLRKELEKQEAISNERKRISSDMHDDLASGLTSIRMLSEIARNKSSGIKIEEIDKISSSAEVLMENMRDIVWALSVENNTLEDLVFYIRKYGVEFLDICSIQYQFDIPESIPDVKLSAEKKRNLFLSVKESLHNIVKHAGATMVTLQFNFNTGIKILIADNGNGIDVKHMKGSGYGLKNMKSRMESIGGTFMMENKNGTMVELSCPFTEQG